MEVNGGKAETSVPERKFAENKEPEVQNNISMLEKNIIKLVIQNSKYYSDFITYKDIVFKSGSGHKIFSTIHEIYKDGEEIDINKLADQLEPAEGAVLGEIMGNVQISNEQQLFKDCIDTIRSKELVQKEKEIIMRLSMADEDENIDSIRELTEELMKIQKLLKNR